ncbi:MAG: hypothetical protein AAB588_02475 [Patescibacteria group bacterium]
MENQNQKKRWFRGRQQIDVKDPKVRHAFDNEIFAWKAPEYLHHEKSLVWFGVAFLLVLGLVIYGLETDGWTFSLAVIVFAGTYYLVYRHPPSVVDIKISKMGVKIGHHLFPYTNLKGFWTAYDPPHVKKLYLRMAGRFEPDIFVSLEDADPSEVRRLLREHITELSGKHEPFSDTLVRLFRL